MAQQLSKPPEQNKAQPPISQPSSNQYRRSAKTEVIIFLGLISFLILSSTGLLLFGLIQPTPTPQAAVHITHTATTLPIKPTQGRSHGHTTTPAKPTPTMEQDVTPTASSIASPVVSPTATPPIVTPGNTTTVPALQLPANHYIIYEQPDGIYMVSSTSGLPQILSTPGYIYNQAVDPILTPSGQLLYSGNGLWLTDVFSGITQEIATIDSNQVITSLVLSNDGTTVAWSTEPMNGKGLIDLYAGLLTNPVKVFEQPAASCPCFRVFAFMNGTGKQGDTELLLTDGQQSHEAIQFGLWTLDLTNSPAAPPQPLLASNTSQGPLALAPSGNVLLYSSYEGIVSVPTDGSVPTDIATLYYPNSLKVTTLDGQPLAFDTSQVILPEQHELSNSAAYHWVTTPVFTLDGHTLIYVEFSSQGQPPYDRSSAIFMAQISGSGKHLRVSQPQLMATVNVMLLELGVWFNDHVLTFYGDGILYALDIQSGAVATIAQTGVYARPIAVVGTGGV